MKYLIIFPSSTVEGKWLYNALVKSLISIFIPFQVFLQNLSPNPSFEEYIECPDINTNFCSINIAQPWISLSGDDSDYFNSCASENICGVPYSSFTSFQFPKDGEGMAGIWILNSYGLNYREYLQVKLLDTLISQRCYLIKFYANLFNGLIYSTNNIGLYVSQNQINTAMPDSVLDVEPQIVKYNNPIINDTLNWIEVSGIYVAQGGEEYITIGNFKFDNETDTLNTGNGTYPGAYYYIDDVSLIPIDSIPGGIPAYAGADATIFIGDSIYIGQEISNLDCTWSTLQGQVIATNKSAIYVSPTDTTTYVVEQNLCGSITYDTVTVNTILKAPVVSANAPLNFCSGDSVMLTSDVASGIVWSPNGETTPSITVSESGTYYVTRTFNNYTAVSEVVTITVTTTPEPTIASFPPMCDTNAFFTFTQGSPTGGVYTVNGITSVDFDPNSNLIGDNVIEYTLANGFCVGTASTILTVVGCTVGLEENTTLTSSASAIVVFPNPNDGNFTIDLSKIMGVQHLSISDAWGRTIKHFEHSNSKFDVKLGVGVYFLEVVSENGRYLEKIVVN